VYSLGQLAMGSVSVTRRKIEKTSHAGVEMILPPQYDSVDEALTVLIVDQALDKLPSIYGDVMRLVRDGFTQSEIAGRLGIPVCTVQSRIANAEGTLRAELASLRGGGEAS
jgi:DNA-directed RNA polymerase specialized sigma24 family protein